MEEKVEQIVMKEVENKNPDISILEAALNTMSEAVPEMQGLEGIASVMALPNKEFNIFAPMVLGELEKSLNNVSDKLILVQTLNATGNKAEDLVDEFERIVEQIDVQMTSIPRAKRDFIKRILGMLCNAIADTEGIAKKIIQIPFELCHPDAKMPSYANPSDAGMDIYAIDDVTIHPGETVLVKTGLKCAIPLGYEIQVRPKSGISLKTRMRIANSPGTIDSGYRDEIGVIIDNVEPPIKDISYKNDLVDGKPVITVKSILHGSDMHITKGQKFAQLVLNEVPKAAPYQVEDVGKFENDGRKGGFGSTGVK